VSDVERLRDELALAEAVEQLEEAREKMHDHPSEEAPSKKAVAAYREKSEAVAALRSAFREQYPRVAESGENGVATPDPVRITGKAVEP